MVKFYTDSLVSYDLKQDGSFLKVKDCIVLIEGSEFKDELIRLFDIDSIKEDLIPIQGLSKIVQSIVNRDKKYQKIDIDSHISDTHCVQIQGSNDIKIVFKNVEKFSGRTISANAIYNTKKDYFDSTYKLDKFAKFCIDNDCFEIIEQNIDALNSKFKDSKSHTKSYRLLIDSQGEYYVRAITSVDSYNDYNIRFSLFVTIISLYRLSKNTGEHYEISRCEYSESAIRLFVKKLNSTQLQNIGSLSFVLEMSNDEIKREAFKFEGLFNISLLSNDEEKNIYLKPKDIKTKFSSIKHNFKPETVIANLSNLAEFIENAEDEMKSDIINLHSVKSPDQLRHVLALKIGKSSNTEIGKYKERIKRKLDIKIASISELLDLMSKIDILVDETDLSVKEYLRYVFFDILRSKK